jgi:hypothetical protein
LAKEAVEILEDVKIVSDVSGVQYCLEYNEPYYDRDNVLSSELETWAEENGVKYYGSSFIGQLHDALGNMEHESRLWYSSSIDC